MFCCPNTDIYKNGNEFIADKTKRNTKKKKEKLNNRPSQIFIASVAENMFSTIKDDRIDILHSELFAAITVILADPNETEL